MESRGLAATVIGVAALLVLIIKFRMNAFLALITIAIGTALFAGMSAEDAFTTVQKGVSGTLGFIAVVIGLGALFGTIIEHSGGIGALSRVLTESPDPKQTQWTMSAVGLIAAIPVFFDVALLILLPLILNAARRSNRPAMSFGLPVCAGLAVGHAFIPPTPGPMAIAELLSAELGWVILFGSIVGLVAVAVSGPMLAGILDRRGQMPWGLPNKDVPDTELPKCKASWYVVLGLMVLPIGLMLIGTLAKLFLADGVIREMTAIVGHPFSALIIACAAAYFFLRPETPEAKAALGRGMARAFEPTGAVILITGAGGAFKQVLVDTGAGAQIAAFVLVMGFTPLLMGYAVALIVRLVQGSATVAMVTAAGLMAPVTVAAGIDGPALGLIAVAIAAGASGFSHVNDSGFWLVSRLFRITEGETLRTWTLSTGVLSVTALIACIVLSFVIPA